VNKINNFGNLFPDIVPKIINFVSKLINFFQVISVYILFEDDEDFKSVMLLSFERRKLGDSAVVVVVAVVEVVIGIELVDVVAVAAVAVAVAVVDVVVEVVVEEAETAVEPAPKLAVRTDGNADSSTTHANMHNILIQCTNMTSAVVFT
jgi:hypothetical protein